MTATCTPSIDHAKIERVPEHAFRQADDLAGRHGPVEARLRVPLARSLGHDHGRAASGAALLVGSWRSRRAHAVRRPSPARGSARSRFRTIPVRMHHPAPTVPFTVPLIFEVPMRGW